MPKPIVSLKSGAEWSDVRAEAAAILDIPPASLLTPQAEEIYQWLIKKANIGKTWSSQDLSKRFKPDPSKDLFWRLRLLRDHRIMIEGEGCWNFGFVFLKLLHGADAFAAKPSLPADSEEFCKDRS